MSLEHILLGMLREPATGYDLGKEFHEGARHFWHAERSQIYPTLGRLEKKGWLRCWAEPSERGPERKVYETTDAGLEELRRWLLDGPHIGRDRLAYIAQTFFLDALEDHAASLRVVEAMRARWRQSLAHLEFAEQQVLADFGPTDEHPDPVLPRYAALRMGILQYRAKLAWCEETIATLRRRLEGGDADSPPTPTAVPAATTED